MEFPSYRNAMVRRFKVSILPLPCSGGCVANIQDSTNRGQWLSVGRFDTAQEATQACIEAIRILRSSLLSLPEIQPLLHPQPQRTLDGIYGGPPRRQQRPGVDFLGFYKLRRNSEEPTGLISDCLKSLLSARSTMLRGDDTGPDPSRRWAWLLGSLHREKDHARMEPNNPNLLTFRPTGFMENVVASSKKHGSTDYYPMFISNYPPLVPQPPVVKWENELQLGDFGLMKPFIHNHDFLHAESNSCTVGSIGYATPEYVNYSRGIALLQLIAGIRGETSTHEYHSPYLSDEIRIDINDDDHSYEVFSRECSDEVENSTMMLVMSDTSLALGGQAIGALMSNAFNTSSSSSVCLVESTIILGLSFTLAGISLHGKRRALSVTMTKLGAVATASGIILSLGSHLPPAMAWIVGSLTLLIIAVAVALA